MENSTPFGYSITGRRVGWADRRANVLTQHHRPTYHPYCARILLSVLRTLVHGAFPWLQPRSPVVQKVVGSGPDHPDAVAVVPESVRAAAAQEARASLRVADESRHPAARASRRGSRAVARRRARVADARAAHARAVVGKAADARAAAGRRVVARAAAVRGGAGSPRWRV